MNSPSFCNLTLRNVETSMLEKNRLQNLLKSSNEALLTFTTELKRIKKVIMAAVLSEDATDYTRVDSSENAGGSVKVGGSSNTAGRGGAHTSGSGAPIDPAITSN